MSSNTTDPCAIDVPVEYNMPLHIGACFIICSFSFLGTMIPVLGKKVSWLRIRELPFHCGKMFGTGVILATALVHMLNPAVQNLTDPCLPTIFSDYTSFAGAISLFAIFFVHFIQFMIRQQFLTAERRKHTSLPLPDDGHEQNEHDHADHSHSPSSSQSKTTGEKIDGTNKNGSGSSQDDYEVHGHDHAEIGDLILVKEKHVSTYILELGIASHSVIIGLTLGVSTEPEFHALLVALTFHQFFEGMALSSVVMDSNFFSKFCVHSDGVVLYIYYSNWNSYWYRNQQFIQPTQCWKFNCSRSIGLIISWNINI